MVEGGKIAVTGASGLVGSALVKVLRERGFEVLRLVRRAPSAADEVEWNPADGTIDVDGLSGVPDYQCRQMLGEHYHRLDPDAREEAVQESTCLAWRMFMSAVERGRVDANGNAADPDLPPITACSLAWYANRAVDDGRRFAGSTWCMPPPTGRTPPGS